MYYTHMYMYWQVYMYMHFGERHVGGSVIVVRKYTEDKCISRATNVLPVQQAAILPHPHYLTATPILYYVSTSVPLAHYNASIMRIQAGRQAGMRQGLGAAPVVCQEVGRLDKVLAHWEGGMRERAGIEKGK